MTINIRNFREIIDLYYTKQHVANVRKASRWPMLGKGATLRQIIRLRQPIGRQKAAFVPWGKTWSIDDSFSSNQWCFKATKVVISAIFIAFRKQGRQATYMLLLHKVAFRRKRLLLSYIGYY